MLHYDSSGQTMDVLVSCHNKPISQPIFHVHQSLLVRGGGRGGPERSKVPPHHPKISLPLCEFFLNFFVAHLQITHYGANIFSGDSDLRLKPMICHNFVSFGK
jgi:hypothetical protein